MRRAGGCDRGARPGLRGQHRSRPGTRRRREESRRRKRRRASPKSTSSNSSGPTSCCSPVCWATSSARTPDRFSPRVRRASARTWTNPSASARRPKPRPPTWTAAWPTWRRISRPCAAQSETEAKAETERMAQQTAAEIAKIQAHAEQEIASAGKAARMASEAIFRRTRHGAGRTESPRPHDAGHRRRSGTRVRTNLNRNLK